MGIGEAIVKNFLILFIALAFVWSAPAYAQGKQNRAELQALPDIATAAIAKIDGYAWCPTDDTGQSVEIDVNVLFNSEIAPGATDVFVCVSVNASEATILATIRAAVKALCIQQQCRGNSVDTLTNAQILTEAVPK